MAKLFGAIVLMFLTVLGGLMFLVNKFESGWGCQLN
jgi:hypothetical protein